MALTFGTSVSATDTSGTSIDLPIISTDANALLVLFVRLDGSIQVDSIADTAGLVWGIRGSVDLGGPLDFEEWFAVSEDALVDNVITVTFTDVTTLVTAEVSSFYGASLDAPFDTHPSLPVSGFAAEQALSTVADHVLAFGGYRFASVASPTAGFGFNDVSPSSVNIIRNTDSEGAIVGVPGILPTNWDMSQGSDDLSTEVVEFGISDPDLALPYFDYHIFGTPADSTDFQLIFDTAAPSDVSTDYVGTIYIKLLDGDGSTGLTNVDLVSLNADSDGDVAVWSSLLTLTETLTRTTTNSAPTPVGGTTLIPYLAISVTSGNAIDLYIRVAGVKFELSKHYLIAEYQTYATLQDNLTVSVGDVGDIEVGIVDAIADATPPEPVIVEEVEAVVIPMTGKTSHFLTDFETDNGTVVEAVYDDDTGDLVSGGSVYIYEQDLGGVTYRVTAINPVISGAMVTFTLRDAEQIS